MATSLKESKKDVRIEIIHAKIIKIGLVDPEIALLMLTRTDRHPIFHLGGPALMLPVIR